MSGVTISSACAWMLGVTYDEFREAGYGLPRKYLTNDLFVTFVTPELKYARLTRVFSKARALLRREFDSDKGYFFGTVPLVRLLEVDGNGCFEREEPLAIWLNACEIGHPFAEVALTQGLPQVSYLSSQPLGYMVLHREPFDKVPVHVWGYAYANDFTNESHGEVNGIAFKSYPMAEIYYRSYDCPREYLLDIKKNKAFTPWRKEV